MSISGIHGQLLEVTVVGCSKLKDTEWISRQDPYVCLDYGSTKVRTPTCTDGGKNPIFQQKFTFTLIEGLREMPVSVWNSNTITTDDFIGSGKIQLLKVLSQGFDDSSWPLQTKTGRHAGEVRVIMHYANSHKPATSYAPSAPYMPPAMPQTSLYTTPPPAAGSYYPMPPSAYPAPHAYSSYPPNPAAYPPSPYHSQPPPAYPAPYGTPSAYPPPPYPPSPYDPSHYHTGPYPGSYPPPPY